MKRLLKKEDPILRLTAEPVTNEEFKTTWLKDLVHNMLEIMKDSGAVGVAAPQIGVSKRLIVFGTAYAKRRKPEVDIPDTILINPSFKPLSTTKELVYEGCLNCSDQMGQVPRVTEIEYTGYDVDGNFISKYASGLEARILQHEVDHLNGLLFFDHISDIESLITYNELKQRLQKS